MGWWCVECSWRVLISKLSSLWRAVTIDSNRDPDDLSAAFPLGQGRWRIEGLAATSKLGDASWAQLRMSVSERQLGAILA